MFIPQDGQLIRTFVAVVNAHALVTEGQQVDGLVHTTVYVHRFVAVGVGMVSGTGKVHQRLQDGGDPPGLLLDLIRGGQNVRVVGFQLQVLGQGGDTGDRIANFVGDTGREPAHGGQALAVHQFVFQQAGFRLVFHQDDAATFGVIGATQGCLVQIEPVGAAFQVQAVFVPVQVLTAVEVVQQQMPVLGQGHQSGTDHVVSRDAGEGFHGVVPHEYLAVVTHRAGGNGEVLKGLTVMAPQVVEFPSQPGQAVLVIPQGSFDIAYILCGAAAGHGFVAQVPFDQITGDGGAQQS